MNRFSGSLLSVYPFCKNYVSYELYFFPLMKLSFFLRHSHPSYERHYMYFFLLGASLYTLEKLISLPRYTKRKHRNVGVHGNLDHS